MLKSFCVVLLSALMVSAQPALAQAQPTAAAPGTAATTADEPSIVVEGKKEKKVCRKFPPKTGSRFGDRRECKTVAEWRIADATTKRMVDNENKRGNANQAQDWNDLNQGAMGKPLPR